MKKCKSIVSSEPYLQTVSEAAQSLELLLTSESSWNDIALNKTAFEELKNGLNIEKADFYGVHLFSMIVQFRKLEINAYVRQLIEDVSDDQRVEARRIYIERARYRMMAYDPDAEDAK